MLVDKGFGRLIHRGVHERLPLVLHEDDDLLVVTKPPGWNTHAPDPFALIGPPARGPERLRAADQAANPPAVPRQPGEQVAADISGRAGEEDEVAVHGRPGRSAERVVIRGGGAPPEDLCR